MTSSSRSKAYPCSHLPEYAWLAAQDGLRSELIQKHTDTALRHQEARTLVELHVLGKVRYGSESARFIATLRRGGVDKPVVADSLARAWLAGADEFEVPQQPRGHVLRQSWALVLVSMSVALVTLVATVFWLRKVNPDLELYFLALPPLMGLVGYAVAAAVFTFLRRMTRKQSPAVGKHQEGR